MPKDLISKLKDSKLVGRSGSGFPTGLKWELVKKASLPSGGKKYIVCNAAEGEPDIFKDKFILEKYPEEVVNGIKLALKTVGAKSAYIYLNPEYYKKIEPALKKIIGKSPIIVFKKPLPKYIGGEETAVIEVIEGKRMEPRVRPPYVTEVGLFDCPTIVNNVETFYYVSKIAKDKYEKTRFYSITGDIKNKGVYELPEKSSIEKILNESSNYPDFDFFVQVGGGACGEILLPKELKGSVCGSGSIIVFNRKKTNVMALMKKWAKFFHEGNCDKCAPFREGAYRISEMLKTGKIDKKILDDLFFVLEKTSFCSLGKGIPTPFRDAINKLLK